MKWNQDKWTLIQGLHFSVDLHSMDKWQRSSIRNKWIWITWVVRRTTDGGEHKWRRRQASATGQWVVVWKIKASLFFIAWSQNGLHKSTRICASIWQTNVDCNYRLLQRLLWYFASFTGVFFFSPEQPWTKLKPFHVYSDVTQKQRAHTHARTPPPPPHTHTTATTTTTNNNYNNNKTTKTKTINQTTNNNKTTKTKTINQTNQQQQTTPQRKRQIQK